MNALTTEKSQHLLRFFRKIPTNGFAIERFWRASLQISSIRETTHRSIRQRHWGTHLCLRVGVADFVAAIQNLARCVQGLAGGCLGLGDFVFVVLKDQVGTTEVDVDGRAELFVHHRRARDVPARAPWGQSQTGAAYAPLRQWRCHLGDAQPSPLTGVARCTGLLRQDLIPYRA